MSNKKIITEYNDKYGEIEKEYSDRFNWLLRFLELRKTDLKKLRESIKTITKAKWKEEYYVIYLVPKATPRARHSGRTKTFYVKNAANNNKLFSDFVKETSQELFITTPTKITIDSYFPTGKMSKINTLLAELRLIRPVSKPDFDNVAKTYCDMIQNNIILDDSLIVEGLSRKFYSIKPRIEIKIEYMAKYDTLATKKKIESWKTYKDNEYRIKEVDSEL